MDCIVCNTSAACPDPGNTSTTLTLTVLLTVSRMSSSLETELPPASVLWLAHEHTLSNTAQGDVIGKQIAKKICTYFAISKYYIYDVVQVCAQFLSTDAPAVTVVEPSYNNRAPAVSVATMQNLAKTICQGRANDNIVAMFVYALAHPCVMALPRIAVPTAPHVRLSELLYKVVIDCKFEVTSDLFIWSILYIMMPAWVSAARTQTERPYALAPSVFGENTNIVVQPWIKRSVSDMMLDPSIQKYQLFCMMACLAMELTNSACGILTNIDVLKAMYNTPTFVVLSESLSLSGVIVFGYVYHGSLYLSDDPLTAVAQWASANDACPHFADVACDTAELMPGNPFSKFLAVSLQSSAGT